MTKIEQAERAYNEAKMAAERRYVEAMHNLPVRGGHAARDAAAAAAKNQLVSDMEAAEDAARRILAPEPHWGETEWAKQNVGLN